MYQFRTMEPSRRQLLKTGIYGGGALVLGFYLPPGAKGSLLANTPPALDFSTAALPNAFIKIGANNIVTIISNKLEMGQGINTALAQLIAEELELDWKQVRCESAPVNPVYNHTSFGTQMTGGSTSLASSWDQLRRVGATAREMLISAAAKKWGVAPAQCKAQNGRITHAQKGSVTYGEVAAAAAKEAVPANPKLKDPKDFKIIGRSPRRVDADAKTDGTAIFGIDVRVPGLVYAVIARPPFGAKLGRFDADAARKVPGVLAVQTIPGDRVAVVAKHTWAAMKGREALNVQWQLSDLPELSQAGMEKQFKALLDQKGTTAKTVGQAQNKIKASAKQLEAEYQFPMLAHASMEPINCTVSFDGKQAKIWSGHQLPAVDRGAAAAVLGIAPEAIEVVTTYTGGSFGRRASKTSDYITEACEVAKLQKKPVMVVWSREDDMRGGYYRPLTFHKVKAGLDAKGRLQGWHHTISGQSVFIGSMFGAETEKTGIDPTSIEGVADTPYAFSDFEVQLHLPRSQVTTLWWRAVGHTHTAYVMETFIDELAVAAGEDPLAFRQKLLAKSPRHLGVLKLLAKESKWGQKAPAGRAYGLAIHESFASVVGHVVEVSLQGENIRVHRVISAVDCGTVVNPEGARAQIESGIVYGLSACLYEELTLDRGQVVEGNFDKFPMLRIDEMPEVKVHFVASKNPPTGLGEPGLPPIAPAVANAIFRLNGKRIRVLPFKKGLTLQS